MYVFCLVLKPGKSKIKARVPSVSSKDPLSDFWMAVFPVRPHREEGRREFSRGSLVRALIPFIRVPVSWPYHFPKALPPHHWRSGFQQVTLGGGQRDTNIQSTVINIHQNIYSDFHWTVEIRLTVFISFYVSVFSIFFYTEHGISCIPEKIKNPS